MTKQRINQIVGSIGAFIGIIGWGYPWRTDLPYCSIRMQLL